MLLEEFNSARPEDALGVVRPALDIPRWCDAIVEGRPYVSVALLQHAAMTVAAPLSDAEVDAALAHHPRIGECAQGDTAEAAHARSEQAGVDESAADALAEANRAYEAKFGRVFLVRAAGRSAEDILALLRTRMQNTEQQELAVIDQQLREIAALRLTGAVSPSESESESQGAQP